MNRGTAVNLDINLVNVGAGANAPTLTTNNIQLYRTRDNALVPGIINTTGGNDAIVYQPSRLLDANTNYTFRLGNGVQDQAGNTFLPFSTTFSTGSSTPGTTTVSFTKSQVFSGSPISSLLVSPNGSYLYSAALDGVLRRWSIGSSGNLTNLQTFSGLVGNPNAPRAIIGLAFDPNNSNVLWVSHNNSLVVQPADDFSGKISKLTFQNTTSFNPTVQDYVVGLPRSAKDHLSNSLAFGPDGKLYITQGSNSAMGAPDASWYQRPERLLSSAVLQINPNLTPPSGRVQCTDGNYGTTTGNYNPAVANAPVKLYATGIRNAYDLVWHSNGSLYIPANGSAAGGNTPDNPTTSANERLTNVATQNDYLLKGCWVATMVIPTHCGRNIS
ncbi:MAG: hypothetical protein HC772_15525 [Leptolyngbyaceae cyanobacterium CRU_2_3]|nr:hypothetical protein [Leptolyngbyaceae cyanobacterium CRU_2_3]